MSINKNYDFSRVATQYFVREGEGDGSGSTPPDTITLSAADLQKKIEEATNAAVGGLKKKNDELLGAMRELKEKNKSFEGMDAGKIKDMLQRMEQDEDLKLLAEGKANLVIERHTERMRAQHIADLAAKDEAIKAESQRADLYRGSVLDNQIRAAAVGLHKGAIEDALLHARNVFTLDAKGNAVQLDSDGRPVLGKDGSTPFSPAEWIEMQKELKPHWFPASSSGSGSGGARDAGGASGGKIISRANFDKLTHHEQSKIAREGIKIVD